jgi:hypothetical protein
MQYEGSRKIKQLYPGKFLFFLNSKDIYYLIFEIIDTINIKVILIKLKQKETYVYQATIPFQKFGTNNLSVYDTFKNINFTIYNFDFSLSDEYNKIFLTLNSSNAKIELLLYNQNIEKNNDNIKRQVEMKNNMEKMKNRMNELMNIISNQKKKISDLKQKEESQIKLINKVEEVTKKISEQYQSIKENNNNIPQNNMNNNNYNNQNNNNNFNYDNSNDFNMGFKRNRTLSYTVNVELRPYLPDNANMDNLLTRPQNMNPLPQQPGFDKKRSINLDYIEDYRNKK